MRNTSRLLFALILVSCVCIALLQPVEKAASREIPVHSTRSAAEEEKLIRKMDVSRLIHDRFGCAEDGSWIYPADYAGLFDDGTMLVLSIKKGASKEEYQSILQEYGDIFKIQEVEYSWNELHQQAVKAANKMIQRNIHVSSYCVDAESNKIVFTAPEEDVENVFRVLEEEEITELSEVDLQDPGELNLTLRGGDYVSCDQA